MPFTLPNGLRGMRPGDAWGSRPLREAFDHNLMNGIVTVLTDLLIGIDMMGTQTAALRQARPLTAFGGARGEWRRYHNRHLGKALTRVVAGNGVTVERHGQTLTITASVASNWKLGGVREPRPMPRDLMPLRHWRHYTAEAELLVYRLYALDDSVVIEDLSEGEQMVSYGGVEATDDGAGNNGPPGDGDPSDAGELTGQPPEPPPVISIDPPTSGGPSGPTSGGSGPPGSSSPPPSSSSSSSHPTNCCGYDLGATLSYTDKGYDEDGVLVSQLTASYELVTVTESGANFRWTSGTSTTYNDDGTTDTFSNARRYQSISVRCSETDGTYWRIQTSASDPSFDVADLFDNVTSETCSGFSATDNDGAFEINVSG
ncbi:MAG: hypothetical protein AAGH92_08610 [Planctomycetota bacterium]